MACRICRILMLALIVLFVLALAVWVIGIFGLFGTARDPLSGVFLVPLGYPWNRAIDSTPEAWWPWLAAAAPLLNIAVLAILCRLACGSRKAASG